MPGEVEIDPTLGLDVSGQPLLQIGLDIGLGGLGADQKLEMPRRDAQGKQMDFLTGFEKNTTVFGRPTGILVNDEKSFFVTDDFNGAIYYIEKK